MTHPIRSAAVLGAGTMGAQIAAHLANAGVPVLLLDLTADVAQGGPEAGAGAQAGSVLHPGRARAHHHRRLRHRPGEARRTPTGSSKRSSSSSTSSARCSSGSTPSAARARSSRRTPPGIPIASAGRRTQRRLPPALARHALLQPAALPAPGRGDSDRRHRSRRRRARVGVLPITASARASSSRRTRRTSSATTSRLYGVMLTLEGARERPLHHRGDRRDHRSGARPAEERHVPDDGHRRRRHPGARRQQPRLRAAGVRARDDRERHGRREGRTGFLQADQDARTAARS